MASNSGFVQAPTTAVSENYEPTETLEVLEPLQTDGERQQALRKLYAPLQPWETRLIALQPGDFDDPLVVKLQTAVITHEDGFGLPDEHRSVRYEALSYTWGGEILSHPLICNGFTVGITKNLCTALRYLRLSDEVRFLWVDAICIHQADKEEKARQIRNLRLVFKRASQVVAWLGEESADSQIAMEALESAKTSTGHVLKHASWAWALASRSTPSAVAPETQLINALVALARRPWLSRAWVVQEVCAAKSISVHCGRHILDWVSFARIIYEIEYAFGINARPAFSKIGDLYRNLSPNEIHAMKAIRFLAETRERTWVEERNASHIFYNLLSATNHLEATDPRDRIWALAGVAGVPIAYGADDRENNEEKVIRIDYTKSIPQVYAETTRFFLQTLEDKRLSILSGSDNPQLMPSWSLDFPNMSLSWSDYDTLGRRRLGTLYKRTSHHDELVRISSNTMTIQGCHIGTVTSSKAEVCKELPPALSNEIHPVTCASVRHTFCLAQWVLDDALKSELLSKRSWKDIPSELQSHLAGIILAVLDTPSLKSEVKARLKLMIAKTPQPRYVPRQSVAECLQNDKWIVRDDVKRDDIIVHSLFDDKAYVLRKVSATNYTCLGRATPKETLCLRYGRTLQVDPVRLGWYPAPSENSSHLLSDYVQSFDIV